MFRSRFSLYVSFCLLFAFFAGFSPDLTAQRPTALNGILNASQWDFRNERLPLNGSWLWYNNELLNPEEVFLKKGTAVEFPKLWNEVRPFAEGGGQGLGVATYTLKLIVPDHPQELAFEIPQIYSSYKMWVNGELLAENGKVSSDPESCEPQWRPQTVVLHTQKDTLGIVLQIANFHHNKGGCKEPIFIGDSALMTQKSNLDTLSNWGECGLLIMLSVTFLYFYFQRERKIVSLYFAFLCLAWAVRSVFSNRYVFISEFPDFNWAIMVRIEYLTLFLTMIWGILFVDKLFPQEVNALAKYALVLINISFVATALVAPPVVFTRWLSVYLSVSAIILFYGAFIVIRGWINEHAGSSWITVSIFWIIGIFAYDIFSYEGLFAYNSVIFSSAYVVVFSLMGVALLYHLDVFKTTMHASRLTFDEMYKDGPKI